MRSENLTVKSGVDDHTFLRIISDKAAGVFLCRHGTAEAAVADQSAVFAGKTADADTGFFTGKAALNVEVPDDGRLGQIAEKSRIGVGALDKIAADRMSLTFKDTAKAAETVKIYPGKVDVGLQQNSDISGTFVKHTFLGKR